MEGVITGTCALSEDILMPEWKANILFMNLFFVLQDLFWSSYVSSQGHI